MGKKEKKPSWAVKDKDATCESKIFETPIYRGCEVVLGRALLAFWLQFFLHVLFYPLRDRVFGEGDF